MHEHAKSDFAIYKIFYSEFGAYFDDRGKE